MFSRTMKRNKLTNSLAGRAPDMIILIATTFSLASNNR